MKKLMIRILAIFLAFLMVAGTIYSIVIQLI